jgi:hypothetical protein
MRKIKLENGYAVTYTKKKFKFSIPDPEVKKASDLGSGDQHADRSE